jgi:hypothetical protein
VKFLIAGTRDIKDKILMNTCIEVALTETNWVPTEVVSGCADGADMLGELWAIDHHIPIKPFPADWKMYGNKAAGPIRNKAMALYADCGVIVCNDDSKGSSDMIKQMIARSKPFVAFHLKNMIPKYYDICMKDYFVRHDILDNKIIQTGASRWTTKSTQLGGNAHAADQSTRQRKTNASV